MSDPIPLPVASVSLENGHTGELSDADLEQVVGGLARVWHADAPQIVEPLPVSLSISSIVTLGAPHRIPA
jgi:hypothetical protein